MLWSDFEAEKLLDETMRILLILVLLLAIAGCDTAAPDTATPSPTATDTHTHTPQPTATETLTPTLTPTITPSPTETTAPTITPTPAPTFTPSITPQPMADFSFDNWDLVDLPDAVRGGLASPRLIFINTNNQQTIGNIATAQPGTNVSVIYLASPAGAAGRVPLLELPAISASQLYLAPPGNAIAYFRAAGADSGLYILNLSNGLNARLIPLNSLVQRGLVNEPAWSPDGRRLALAVATGYDMDIFIYEVDGSARSNLTASGSYDFWPSWSPDGRYIAFVSDRAVCPSWIPGDEGACDALTDPPPTGGHVYLADLQTGSVTQVSNEWVAEPPYWVNNRLLALAGGDQFDLLNPTRSIWLADVVSGQVQQARLQGDGDGLLYLQEAWSPDGRFVLFQRVDATSTSLVLMTAAGAPVRQRDELTFPRFGVAAAWSPDSERIAIGGLSGQCPYGVRVSDNSFGFVASGSPPPSMCAPAFSPDGQYIAFTGINPRVDGRVDVYTANFNGFGAVNLTGDLRGSIELVGWVGPR